MEGPDFNQNEYDFLKDLKPFKIFVLCLKSLCNMVMRGRGKKPDNKLDIFRVLGFI